jgi:hypothetical protein
LEHIAEEIEDMGKRDRREVVNRSAVLVTHLLKWQFQPERRSRSAASWANTISTQRRELRLILDDSPSLQRHLRQELDRIYTRAVKDAVRQTKLPRDPFPQQCPYTLEQVLDLSFLVDT